MEPPFPSVRRQILLAVLASITILVALALVISPLVISFAPHAAQQARLNYLWSTPPLMGILAGLAYWYMAPIAQLRLGLKQGKVPSTELIRRARRAAFNTPVYLFVAQVGATLLATFLSDIIGLLLIQGYELALYFSKSLLTIAVAVSTGLLLALVARWRLRSVLATTNRLTPPSRLPSKEGHRFSIRARLLGVILALTIVACYLPSILGLNMVQRAVRDAAYRQHREWVESTIQNLAPFLDDEALIRYVEEISLPDGGQAFIKDSQGNYITRLPTPFPSPPNPDEHIEPLPMNRSGRDWHLGVVYKFHAESDPLVRHTALLLLIFDVVIVILTLPFTFAVTADITDDLRQVTQRMLGVAWRGEVGERLPVLSLDEVGDLVRAFNDIQERVQSQQKTLRQEHWRLLALQAISSRISAIFDLDQLLDELAKSATTIFGYYNTLILLPDKEGKGFYIASSGRSIPPEIIGRRFDIETEKSIQDIIRSGEALLIPNLSERDFETVSSPGVRSVIVAPMFVRGNLIGFFQAESDQPASFEKQDTQLVTSLANQAGATIESARLLQKSRAHALEMGRWARNLMLINRVATTLATSLDAREILDMAVQHLAELIGVDYGSALILEQDRQHGLIIAEYPESRLADFRLQLPHIPEAWRMIEAGNVYQAQATDHSELLDALQAQHRLIDFQSLLLVPLIARDEMIGILLLVFLGQPRTFTDEEIDICQTVASQAAVAVANARLLQDIQQQQRALIRKSQELTAESSKLDAILNNVADGLVATDASGRVILSNPAFREMANLPPTHPVRDQLLTECFPNTLLQNLTVQALESPGRMFTENLELDSERVLKASTTALHLPPENHEEGSEEPSFGTITVLRDITREVALDRAKTDFIAAVSHELRTPLTSILGFASLIRREIRRRIIPHLDTDEVSQQAAERIQDNLDIIEQESLRITRLINDMLDIAKMEAGRMEWRLGQTNLGEVINQAVNATATLAEEKGLPIEIHLHPDGLPAVWADRDRLIQVMTNLLANAIKFTDHGKIEVRGWMLEVQGGVSQRTGPAPPLDSLDKLNLPTGEWVVVSVTDTGVGFRQEDAPYIFEKYRQVGDSAISPVKGTGLGLSISKEIVEHHGGLIWAESEYNQGSTFSFALPVRPSP
ncbi:MAG: GAF domain-containing protein [Anaerolineae bacterium]|nr:GAF domain-containing protein [Anaerolineae bacterium]